MSIIENIVPPLCFGAFLGWVGGMLTGAFLSDKYDVKPLKAEAIKRGFAAYVITNTETGDVTFTWKDGAK